MQRNTLMRLALALLAATALMLAGCGGDNGTTAPPMPPDPDPALMAAQTAAMAAEAAAKTAYEAARDALAGVTAMKDADPASYARAENDVADAKSAYDAAKAANAMAQAADMAAAAQAAQATAESARDDAQDARDAAVTHAGMVATAHQAELDRIAAVAEAKALADAKTAAMTAYSGAKDALAAAQMAVNAVMADADANMDAYNMAVAAVADAQTAYNAAMAANTAAQAATASADAKVEQAKAEQAKMDAESAQASAEMYAGRVRTAANEQMNAAERLALANARNAAMTAYEEARDAYDDAKAELSQVVNQADDPVAYRKAQDGVASAKSAYEAARDANTAAQLATTSEAAKRHQATAEAERQNAQDALADARMYAGMVNQSTMDKAAAVTAMDDAKMEYDAAMKALADVEDKKADDMDSYNMAMAEVEAAQAAYMAAKEASGMAQAATSAADAKKYADMAKAELAKAETANSNAMMYAKMVSDAYEVAEGRRMEVNTARTAAMEAVNAAKKAYDAAKMAVDALEDKKADDIPNHTRAMDQVTLAKAAYDAAKAASEAADATDDPAMADQYRMTAEAERDKAVAANLEAMRFAGLVVASYNAAEKVRMDARVEAKALADAKDAAMKAATAARDAATEARENANKVAELLGADSDAAVKAAAAAKMAEDAAEAAEMASTNAQADTMSADAEAEQATAEGKRDEARTQLAESERLADEAGVAHAGLEQLRIELARDAAEDAKNMAASYAMKAREAAGKAREEANAARVAANMAKKASTDYAEADMKAKAAETAATAAETAATAAETAATAANTAYMTAMGATTSTGARDARDEARSQRDVAKANYDGDMGADAHYKAAKMARMEADTASVTYKLALLKYVSGQGLETADARARAQMVAGWIAGAVNADENEDNTDTQRGLASEAGTKVFALVGTGDVDADNSVDGLSRLNTADDTDATATNLKGAVVVDKIGTGEGKDRVYHIGTGVGADGGAVHLMTGAGADTPSMDDDVMQMDLGMLGDFTGVELSMGLRYAHIYTDYDESKNTPEVKAGNINNVAASSGTFSGTFNVSAPATSITGITDAGDGQGKFTYNGVTYPSITGAVLTLTCAASADCSFTSTGANNAATITSLGSGWRVTGAVTEMAEVGDPDYLTFGIWLDNHETSPDDDNDNPAMQVGAFASGNDPFAWDDAAARDALTGKATYRGSAAGLHSKSGAENSVMPFNAKAMLTADFGTATAEQNMIGGKIYDIVSGGTTLTGAMSEITLANQSIAEGGSGVAGRAVMGTPMVESGSTTATYMYNGHWDYRFFGDAVDTTDATKRHPTSVGGTFAVTGMDNMGTMNDMDDDVTQSFIGAFGAHR